MPTIATNWSGPTDFMTEQNSYPLMIDGLIKVNQKEVVGEFWANVK